MLVFSVVAVGVSFVICGNPASWNVFERLADLDDGCYPRLGPWWKRS
jgi:hypothetical protein